MGFFSAWGYWLCATIGVVGYLVIAFAALGSFVDTPDSVWFGEGNTLAAFIGESCILWAVHLLVARGVQQAALFNLVATLAKSLPLLLFILFACYWFDPVTFAADQQGSTLAVPVSEQVRNTMLITLWVFTGIEGAAVLSARARNKRDVGTATVLGVVLALLLYVLISVLALGILSRPELAALPNPSMAGLMAQMTGSWGKVLISVGLIVSVLASYVSWTLFSAEVPFSAARHGAFPAIFRRQNRNGTPIASLWLTSLTVQGCLLLVWLLGKGYTNLLLISTSMILVPYLLIGLFLLKLSLSGQGNGLVRAVALVSSGYGLWLLYAAGVEYLLLSLAALRAGPAAVSLQPPPARSGSAAQPARAAAGRDHPGEPGARRLVLCPCLSEADDPMQESALMALSFLVEGGAQLRRPPGPPVCQTVRLELLSTRAGRGHHAACRATRGR